MKYKVMIETDGDITFSQSFDKLDVSELIRHINPVPRPYGVRRATGLGRGFGALIPQDFDRPLVFADQVTDKPKKPARSKTTKRKQKKLTVEEEYKTR